MLKDRLQARREPGGPGDFNCRDDARYWSEPPPEPLPPIEDQEVPPGYDVEPLPLEGVLAEAPPDRCPMLLLAFGLAFLALVLRGALFLAAERFLPRPEAPRVIFFAFDFDFDFDFFAFLAMIDLPIVAAQLPVRIDHAAVE